MLESKSILSSPFNSGIEARTYGQDRSSPMDPEAKTIAPEAMDQVSYEMSVVIQNGWCGRPPNSYGPGTPLSQLWTQSFPMYLSFRMERWRSSLLAPKRFSLRSGCSRQAEH